MLLVFWPDFWFQTPPLNCSFRGLSDLPDTFHGPLITTFMLLYLLAKFNADNTPSFWKHSPPLGETHNPLCVLFPDHFLLASNADFSYTPTMRVSKLTWLDTLWRSLPWNPIIASGFDPISSWRIPNEDLQPRSTRTSQKKPPKKHHKFQMKLIFPHPLFTCPQGGEEISGNRYYIYVHSNIIKYIIY